jgi:sugar phosphate isomerase/epimerase
MQPGITLFPKFFANFTAGQLADLCTSTEVDSVDIVIRDGFAVTPAGIQSELPSFAQALSKAGIHSGFAVTPFGAERLAEEIDLLLLMADHGIRAFRLDYFPLRPDVRVAMREARSAMERLAPLCSLSGNRAVVQVHHVTLIQSASAAYELVRDLPVPAVGVQLDTGNQRIEGYENWDYSVPLLGGYLHSVGVKDVALPGTWVECGKGDVPWGGLFDSLAEARFSGSLNMMPFYSDDPTELKEGLRREVQFVREHYARRESVWNRD